MALKASLVLLENYGDEVYDSDCGCYFSRNAEGDLVLSRDGISYTLEELVSGPCAGFYGSALDKRINSMFTIWVRNGQMAADCEVAESGA